MYDPEEACNENDEGNTEEAKGDDGNDDKWAEVDAMIDNKEEEDEVKEEIQEEVLKTPPKRAGPTTRVTASAAKNGSTPRGKARGRK